MAAPPQPPLARIVVRSTLWTTLGNNLTQLIGFAAILLLTRALTPEAFGYFALAGFWVGLLGLRAKLGLSYAAIRQPALTGELLGTYWLLDGLAALGTLALCAAAAGLFGVFGLAPEIGLALLGLAAADLLTTATAPLAMALEKELQLSRLSLLTLLTSLAAYGIAIGLAYGGAGLLSLLAVNLTTSLLANLGVVWVARRRLPGLFQLRWRVDAGLARQLLRQGLPTGLSLTAVAGLSSQYDNFLVGTLVSATALGYYDRAYRIASWPNVLVTAVLSRVGFLTFARVKDEPERLHQAVRLALWAAVMTAVPLGLALALGARDVVLVLYGERWLPSAPWLQFLPLVGCLSPTIGVAFWLSVALGHSRATAGLTGLQLAALLLAATPLTVAYGVPGTLAGVLLAYTVSFVGSCRYIFRQVPLSPWATFGPALLAAGGAAAVTLGVAGLSGWQALPALARLPATLALTGGLYLALITALQFRATVERVRYLLRIWRPAAPAGS